jgi:F-type H+-transporting ATPase subunit alpha
MAIRVDDITTRIRREIESFEAPLKTVDVGYVLEVGDGIARVSGLSDVRASEMVQFENGTLGIAFNLERDQVGVTIMGEYTETR